MAAGIKTRSPNSGAVQPMKTTHLPDAVLLVLVGERKPKEKEKRRKRAGVSVGELSRSRMDRSRRQMQAGGGVPVGASVIGPRGLPLPARYRGPGLPPSPVAPAADAQRARLLALPRVGYRGGGGEGIAGRL
jgi:hypothetical protein